MPVGLKVLTCRSTDCTSTVLYSGTPYEHCTRHCNLFINEEIHICHSSALLGSGANYTAHVNHALLDKTELGQGTKDKKDTDG